MKNKGQIQDGKYYYKYWSLLIFLLIPVLLLARYYFAGQVPGDADLIQFFSNKKAFAEALMSGEFPQWNPYIQNGIPQSSGSSMYFLNLLLSFLPLRQYIYAFYIVHLAIAEFVSIFFCVTMTAHIRFLTVLQSSLNARFRSMECVNHIRQSLPLFVCLLLLCL